MQAIITSILYISSAPYFWQAMSFSFICAMFIGSVIHNGDLSSVNKAIITVGSYAGLLFFINQSRIVSVLTDKTITIMQVGQAYASNTTLVILTVFWVVGLWWGVWVTRKVRNKRK